MTAPATGIQGQVGYAAESTFNTGVTPTRFQEYLDESFELSIARLEAKGVRQNVRMQRSDRWAAGKKKVKGKLRQEIHNKSFGLILKHALGGSSVAQPDAGGNPTVYDQTITPAALDALSMTFEVGWKDTAGNGFKKTITGAQCVGWDISAKLDEYGLLETEWDGADMATATGVTSVSYPSTTTPFTYVQGTATLAGSGLSIVEFKLSGKNPLDVERYFMGSQVRSQAPEIDYRVVTGELMAEFASWTAYDRFVNGTEAAVVLLFEGATISGIYKYQLQITLNVRFDEGGTPTVKGRDRIMQSLPIKAIATSDVASTGLSMLYRSTDSAA